MHGDADEASTKKNNEDIDPKKSFHNKSISQRSVILFAGPAANFIFSIILLVFINCFYGFTSTKPIISEIEKNMPADLSGLQVGDTILEINKKKISDFSKLRAIISSNETIKVTYSRNDKIEIVHFIGGG